jgi:diaminohydroxyphosphoribosylaminopyrimidine deaminase/5-amino-6-(5-phosphoribosylamino)uracil reductase
VVDDTRYMRKALVLAERGRPTTSPNPMVGALVVDDDGVIVGRGSHRIAGGPHAEVIALREAGDRARGATLFCTLEPCSHVGRTGPCAPLVADAGIRRAVIAIEDPNPKVNGEGLRYLRRRGVDVTVGVLRDQAALQNERFFTNVRKRRPFVILKTALSLDGCVAAAPGTRTQLTGPAAARLIHRQRAEVDALGVGVGTVLADDPVLTPRGAYRARPLSRVIFDRRLRTPPDARVLSTGAAGPVIIVSTQDTCSSARSAVGALAARGARVLAAEGPDLGAALATLGEAGIASIVIEGGPTLHGAALEAGVVDLVQLYLAPRLLGAACLKWLEAGRFTIGQLADRSVRWLDDDVLVEGHVHGSH